MKRLKVVLLAVLFSIGSSLLHAQTFYSVIVNVVPDGFRIPLLGLVNIGTGSLSTVEMGLFNWVSDDFAGFQAGTINIVRGDVNGVQAGLFNMGGEIRGLQIGLINIASNSDKGIPIGLISIVRDGYHAIELGASGGSAIHLDLKLGVEQFYTSIIIFYNPVDKDKSFGCGLGLGSIINLGEKFYLNPEINSMANFNYDEHMLLSLDTLFGWNITEHISITAGPQFVLHKRFGDNNYLAPMFGILEKNISDTSRIFMAARAGVRVRF
ncbi:MAG: hypothetical protein Ta2B_03750 [Termitinemataceae bacterium]|nr:MAG: hypothetical protein Ta2B_03750 [Termitinemataceae bacterium]